MAMTFDVWFKEYSRGYATPSEIAPVRAYMLDAWDAALANKPDEEPRLIDDPAMIRALNHLIDDADGDEDNVAVLNLRCYRIGLNNKIMSDVVDQYLFEQGELALENDPELAEYRRLKEKFKDIE